MVTMAATANKVRSFHARPSLPGRGFLSAAFSVFLAMAGVTPAHAIDWRFERSVAAAITYTDNANHSESDPQDALILSVTPRFAARSEGSRRLNASLQYGLKGTARFGENNTENLYHNLNAAGKAELVEDFLFVDGSARVSQQLISLQGSPADAEISDSNRATVGTYSISPYVQKRLGSFATAQARYTASGAIFENNVAANSSVNTFSAGLASGAAFNDLNWALHYSIREAVNRNDVDTTFERASAQLGYALTRKFRVFGTVGRDRNDYLSTTETDGSSYSVGFGWAPSRRTSVEASAGERYFGNTFSFSGSHRTRLSRWTLRYSEDVSDITQQMLYQNNRIFWVCDGNEVIETPDSAPPSGSAKNCVGPVPAGTLEADYAEYGLTLADLANAGLGSAAGLSARGVYIIKSLNAGVSWDVGRLGFGLSAQDTQRLYQTMGGAGDHIRRVTGSVSYRMTPKTTVNSSLSLARSRFDPVLTGGTAREDDILSLSIGAAHRFSDDLNGALIVRHTQRNSNGLNADYSVNSLTATANMRF